MNTGVTPLPASNADWEAASWFPADPVTSMNYHTESGEVTCEWARQAVQDLTIEAGHPSAEHRFSFLR